MVKTKHPNEIFSLCAQWARIFDSTCGPVGQKFHPLGWKLLSHIPNFRGVKVNPKEKYFDTSGVEVVGATGVRVEDPLKW